VSGLAGVGGPAFLFIFRFYTLILSSACFSVFTRFSIRRFVYYSICKVLSNPLPLRYPLRIFYLIAMQSTGNLIIKLSLTYPPAIKLLLICLSVSANQVVNKV
jgi:hypothetical protein